MRKGFTLVELLIVMAIVGVLATAVVIVLNPMELLRQSRDSVRLGDLTNINKAIGLLQAQNSDASLGSPYIVYVSLPDTDDAFPYDCDEYNLPALPTIPQQWFYFCAPISTYREVDNDGWIPIDFMSIEGGSPLSVLPVDPVNSVSNSSYYTYVTGGSWKLTGMFESEKYARTMRDDGGPDYGIFEIGNDLNLANFARGLVGYWKLDETSGDAIDSSGNSNTGTPNGTLTNFYGAPGKVGTAFDFNGIDNYVSIIDNDTPSLTFSNVTVAAWYYADVISGYRGLVSKMNTSLASAEFTLFNYSPSLQQLRFAVNTYTAFTNYSPVPATGAWYHAVGTYDGLDSRLYFNGSQVNTTQNVNPILNTSHPVLIGRTQPGTSIFFHDGKIDDVRLYNRVLSANEIKALYNATK